MIAMTLNQESFTLLTILVLLFLVAPLYVGGTKSQRKMSSSTARRASAVQVRTRVSEYSNLITKLRVQGATAHSSDERVSQPFFSVAGRIVNINGEGIQVFEYARASALNMEAKRVSSDGMTIGGSKPSWMAPPHFFKRGKLIVIYVGNNQTILNILKDAVGEQFAGG